MAAELMLINPRRKRRSSSRRRRTGGRRRKMSALQRAYFGGGRRATSHRRRRRRSVAVTTVAANPRRRRRHSRRRRSIMRVRRNPIRLPSARGITAAIMPAAVGAAGAVGVNYAWNYLAPMLPAPLQSGMGKSIAQLAAAIGIGMAAKPLIGSTKAAQVTAGALTVTLYNMIATAISNAQYTARTGPGTGYWDQWMANYPDILPNYGGANPVAGLAARRRQRRLGRYAGAQMAGNAPRGLNRYAGAQMAGMGGNVPRGINGANRAMMVRGGMGYMGPGRVVGRGRGF